MTTQLALAEAEFLFVAAQLTTAELEAIDGRVVGGQMDGGAMFMEECLCFYGTIAELRDIRIYRTDLFAVERNRLLGKDLGVYRSSPLEKQIMTINPGDTPATRPASAWLHGLLQAELARRKGEEAK